MSKSYSEEALSSALDEVKNATLGIRAAAKKYNVPVTTLHDRMSGKVQAGAKWGKASLLPKEKEKELISYAFKRAELGIGFSKQSFLRFAGKFAASEGVYFPNEVASEKWWRGLKCRHPHFSLRTPEATAAGWHMAMTRLRITRYFSALKSVLTENNLFDKSNLIWNMDETGLSLSPKSPKVIAKKGSKVVHAKASNSRELVTILACGNAAGRVIPPHAIVPGKTKRVLNSYDTANAPVGTNLSVSDSGWTKKGISELWFADTFIPNIGPERPQLLIMDGLEAHHHVELVDIARRERIILVELPSKSSHFTQPFDRSVFKALKTSWAESVQEFTATTGVTVGHAQFFRMLKKAWEASMTVANVTVGFAATGICPYNPGAIPDMAYTPSELYRVVSDSSEQLASAPLPDTPSEVYTAEPLYMPAPSHPDTSSLQCTPKTSTVTLQQPFVSDSGSGVAVPLAEDNLVVSLDINSTNPCIDLPLAIDEAGVLQVLDQNVENASVPDATENVSTCNEVSSSVITECSTDIALGVIESAITDEKKLLYHAAYISGATLDDSMYTTWSMYKAQALKNSSAAQIPQVVPSNPLLTLPKQQFSNKGAKKKPQYFVISSDEAFREQVRVKVEKETRQAELEDRKKKRQLKKEQKEKALVEKVKRVKRIKSE